MHWRMHAFYAPTYAVDGLRHTPPASLTHSLARAARSGEAQGVPASPPAEASPRFPAGLDSPARGDKHRESGSARSGPPAAARASGGGFLEIPAGNAPELAAAVCLADFFGVKWKRVACGWTPLPLAISDDDDGDDDGEGEREPAP